jgi:hypothetical protein
MPAHHTASPEHREPTEHEVRQLLLDSAPSLTSRVCSTWLIMREQLARRVSVNTPAARAERRVQIAAAVRDGATWKEVAVQFGVSMSLVAVACHEHSVRMNRQGPELIEEGA